MRTRSVIGIIVAVLVLTLAGAAAFLVPASHRSQHTLRMATDPAAGNAVAVAGAMDACAAYQPTGAYTNCTVHGLRVAGSPATLVSLVADDTAAAVPASPRAGQVTIAHSATTYDVRARGATGVTYEIRKTGDAMLARSCAPAGPGCISGRF